MKDLVSLPEFSKASGFKNELIAKSVMQFAGLDRLNKLYSSLAPYEGLNFTAAFFTQSNIQLEIDENELLRIPKTGSFISISNHPYGGVDGLALLDLIGRRRTDYKILGNFLLKKIEPISDYFIPVNPFESYKHIASSVTGLKHAQNHLRDGKPLGLFPAGEVSTFQKNGRLIIDRAWQTSALKLIKNAKVPIIPIYFHGHNSWSFHLLGKIHPQLRTLRLPHELTSLHDRTIHIRIGNPISVDEQNIFTDINDFGKFLRVKTYALGSPLMKKRDILKSFTPNTKHQAVIINGIDKGLIEKEISNLHDLKILTQQNFDLYLAPSSKIPNIIMEIGRLREITFRNEGEGTNKKFDLDEFDSFYEHLFLYNHQTSEVVGSYRIGKGNEIINQYGVKGFYTNSLFGMKDEFIPVLRKSIELGRSFIVPKYQNKRLPLLLLWRGILSVLLHNPSYTHIIGPVSISNAYSMFSKSVLVAFIKRYHFDHELATHISPKREYKLDETILQEAESLLDLAGNNLRKLDKIIHDIEPAIKSAPILLKKYIEQNARIIGFNVDPKFNLALDGLMILNIDKIPQKTIQNLRERI